MNFARRQSGDFMTRPLFYVAAFFLLTFASTRSFAEEPPPPPEYPNKGFVELHGRAAVNFIAGNSIAIGHNDYGVPRSDYDFYINERFIGLPTEYGCSLVPHRLSVAENCSLREYRGKPPHCERYRVFRKTTVSAREVPIGATIGYYVVGDTSNLKKAWKDRRMITKGDDGCHPVPGSSLRRNAPPGYVELHGAEALSLIIGNTTASIGQAPIYYADRRAMCRRDGDHASLDLIELNDKKKCVPAFSSCESFRVFKKASVDPRHAPDGALLGFFTDENANFSMPFLQKGILKGDTAGCPATPPPTLTAPVELSEAEVATYAGKKIDGVSEIELPASAVSALLDGNSIVSPSDQVAQCKDHVIFFARDGRLLQQSCLALYPESPKPIPSYYVAIGRWKLCKSPACGGAAFDRVLWRSKEAIGLCQTLFDHDGDEDLGCDKIFMFARRVGPEPDAKFTIEVGYGNRGAMTVGFPAQLHHGDIRGLGTMPIASPR